MNTWKKLSIFLFSDKDKQEDNTKKIIEKWEAKDSDKNKKWDIKVILQFNILNINYIIILNCPLEFITNNNIFVICMY